VLLLALEALTGLGSEAMLMAARQLHLQDLVGDRVTLWRLRQASPLRKGQGRKKLDVEEARALVLISSYLAQQQCDRIRDAVACLEESTEQGHPPHRTAILGDYLDRFSNTYQDRMQDVAPLTPDDLSQLALTLLIDLLFYSSPGGERRLWLALLDRTTHPCPAP